MLVHEITHQQVVILQYITSITKLSNCCILRMLMHEMTHQQVCDIVYSLGVLEIP